MSRWLIFSLIGLLIVGAIMWLGRKPKDAARLPAAAPGRLPSPGSQEGEPLKQTPEFDETRFWSLIDRIDREKLNRGEGFEYQAIEPLTSALQALSREELESFENKMAEKLFAIDGSRYAAAAGEAGGSDDAFLYVRCFVLASGRDVYQSIVEDPAKMPTSLDQWCEALLSAVPQAWERKTGEQWDHSPDPSYETGSNEARW